MFLTILVIATLVAVGVLLAEEHLVRRLRLDRLAASLGPQSFLVGLAAFIVGVIEAIMTIRMLFGVGYGMGYSFGHGFGFSSIISGLTAACLISASIILARKAWRRMGQKVEAEKTIESFGRWAATRQSLLGVGSFILAVIILIRAL